MNRFKPYISLASDLLISHLDKKYVYHNYRHTLDVVTACSIISFHEKIEEREKEVLLLAAWFHDVGYCVNHENHEDYSVEIISKVFSRSDFQSQLNRMTELIYCTKPTMTPSSTLGAILKDADHYHLSQPTFFNTTELLRQEIQNITGRLITTAEWDSINYSFLKKHSYHTPYGQKVLEKGKDQNLQELYSRLQNHKAD